MNLRATCLVTTVASACLCVAAPPSDLPSLGQLFRRDFLVGAAISSHLLTQPPGRELDLVSQQYTSVTAENCMKWGPIHPEPERYDFAAADALVDFAERHGQTVIGHALVWHEQTPPWVFQGTDGNPAAPEVVEARLRDHIRTVVGRYKGRVDGWDVVNEAINDDGTLRDSPWRRALGDGYLTLAFHCAEDADPDAELYYNDYSMERPEKRAATARLVRELRRAGCKVSGVGLQSHWSIDYPTEAEIDATLADYARMKVAVMITELDVNSLPMPWDGGGAEVSRRGELTAESNPYADGFPDEMQQKLAARYASIFRLFRKHRRAVTRVTFWGIGDGWTWLNYWPVPGRTSHPLMFDRELAPKPAFWSVIDVAKEKP
ncbi:MAG: endo-1,4-beta-xylanase [Lacipirellulaceae bacterium]